MSSYDAFADAFAAHAESSAFNAHYDRPAVLELLGEAARGWRLGDDDLDRVMVSVNLNPI